MKKIVIISLIGLINLFVPSNSFAMEPAPKGGCWAFFSSCMKKTAAAAEAAAPALTSIAVTIAVDLLNGQTIDLHNAEGILNVLTLINTQNPQAIATLQQAVTAGTGISAGDQEKAFALFRTAGIIADNGKITSPEIAQLIRQALAPVQLVADEPQHAPTRGRARPTVRVRTMHEIAADTPQNWVENNEALV